MVIHDSSHVGVSDLTPPCLSLGLWTSKLPSRDPAAAPAADLPHIPEVCLEELQRAPKAAPSAAPPALRHQGAGSASSGRALFAVAFYGSIKICCISIC